MFRLSVVLILFVGCTSVNSSNQNEQSKELIYWGSSLSEKIFIRSHKNDFYKLSNFFESQSNSIYCGPTSTAIVLNALRVNQPDQKIQRDQSVLLKSERVFLPQKLDPALEKYTQRSVLKTNGKAKSALAVLGQPNSKGQRDFGLQLKQLNQLLISHGLKTKMYSLKKKSDRLTLKNLIITNLKSHGDFVLVNYKRSTLGQRGGGHISPLGAYDNETDRFLILDVNPNNAPWVWVKAQDLFNAMATFDTIENRGFILVSE